jgi:hypothetical protein
MAAPSTRSSNPAIREVSRGLSEAGDEKILQVVRMVDAMPVRGAADQLIAPLRARLARLRPPRPLRFARLLFLPLDPLIVPAARWRPQLPSIPRTAIPVLAAAMEAALGAPGRTILAMIEGHTTRDEAVVEATGALLWPLAARALLEATPPANWETTGLGIQVHKPLTRHCGALLSQAVLLRRMISDAAHGLVPPEAADVQAFLAGAIEHDPDVLPMAITVLLARIPETAPMLMRVASILGQREGALFRHASEQAADTLLDQLDAPGAAEGQLGGQDLAQAGAAARRLTLLLGALDGEALSKDRRERLNDLRARIDAGCQALFAERLATDLLEPLRACVADGDPDGVWELESAARGLRALETEARRCGEHKLYDRLLGEAADIIREVIAGGGINRGGGLRLIEIVAGPEAALALLGEEV